MEFPSEHDMELLKYIKENQSADEIELTKKFTLSFPARLEKLIAEGYVIDQRNDTAPNDKAHYFGLYRCTSKGKALCEDWDSKLRKDEELKNVQYRAAVVGAISGGIVSVFVSIITSLLCKYLLP